jgi:hypothetical protein
VYGEHVSRRCPCQQADTRLDDPRRSGRAVDSENRHLSISHTPNHLAPPTFSLFSGRSEDMIDLEAAQPFGQQATVEATAQQHAETTALAQPAGQDKRQQMQHRPMQHGDDDAVAVQRHLDLAVTVDRATTAA